MIEKILPWGGWADAYWGNTLGDYAEALLVFFFLLIVFYFVVQAVILRLEKLSKKTQTDVDDTAIAIVRSLRPPFYYFLAFYVALRFLSVSDVLLKSANIVLVIVIVYQVVHAVGILVDYLSKRFVSSEDDEHTRSAARLLGGMLKGVLWALGALLILSNAGVNVTSLIAGLGIGGIAIAFALQGILEDLFASFSIYFDKQFKVGDLIAVGEDRGRVQKIGIKTTRVRSITGEELIISNKELTSVRVENLARMKERRVFSSVGVTYETGTEKLKKIPKMIEELIGAVDGLCVERVHFKSFGDSALIFEFVYYASDDVKAYMDAQQELNFKIREAFEKENIDMAYPTQTLYVKK